MSKKIYKFEIRPGSETLLPRGAKVIHVGMQGLIPCVWAIVDPSARMDKEYRVFGTGHEVPDGWRHVGTWLDAPFVWHLFERCEHDDTIDVEGRGVVCGDCGEKLTGD